MWGRPRGSSTFLTSADVIYFQPSIPGYGERRKIGVSVPSPSPHRTPMLPITPPKKLALPGNLGIQCPIWAEARCYLGTIKRW